MAQADRQSILPTLAWSLAILLAMGIFFGLLVGPALTKSGSGTPHGYVPPKAPADLTEFAPVKGRQAPGINLAVAVAGDPALKGWARDEYGKVCVACHGPEGKGDAPAGLALQARNFTRNEAWKNGPKLTQIFQTLSKGLPPKMPSYDTYSPAQRLALAHVVQGFMTFPRPAASPAEIAAMDAEHSLSAGVRDPGKVGVSVAVQQLAAEAKVASLNLETLPADLRPLVQQPARAAQTVAGLKGLPGTLWTVALHAGAPANGFSPAVGALGGADWQRLNGALAAAVN